MHTIKTIILFSLIGCLAAFAQAGSIQLWPDKVSGFPADYKHKPFVQQDPERITETSRAFMRVFPADEKIATGHGLLIFPGGGYSILADKKEGDRVAKFFASRGITSFVVCYRVSRKGGEKGYQFPGPLLDARQAMRHVRKNAAKYKIDPGKVGSIGFSAGGHLCSMFATRYNDKLEGDPASDISVKPAFAAMIYPVVSAVEPYSHGCTRKILGKNPTKEQKAAISAEQLITKDTPPLFLAHNQFDGVSSHNSTVLAQAATKMKVPCELHLYPEGGHGFGMGVKGKHLAAEWPNLLESFIKRIPEK
ncbi:MAG: alpha/beta hydrolase [Akkermansiaceae bacterium]